MEQKKLFLLDAYALIYRAYYALIRSPRVTSDGRNTSAVFGFCNVLDDILRKESPQYMAVCFDPPHGKTFRHEVYAEYKAQRDKQPEDITASIPYIKDIVRAMGIRVIEVDRYEADDVIGTLATMASGGDFVTYMMTPDKDYGQLVRDNVLMYRPALKGQGFEVRGPKEICERYGIERPEQVIDLLALEGDASDNVPGCPGVGEKTASKLIAEFGSVENLLENTDRVKGALRTKISDNADQIRFSKFLVTIKTDVPLEMTPDELMRGDVDVDRLREIYQDLEFRSFMSRLSATATVADAGLRSSRPADDGMGSLFDAADSPAPADSDVRTAPSGGFRVLSAPEQVAEYAAGICAGGVNSLAFNVAADGAEAMTARLIGIGISSADNDNVYIPWPDFGHADMAAAVQLLVSHPHVRYVSHDVKRDIILLRRIGVELTAPYYDTSIAHYLLKPEMKHELADVAMTVLNMRMPGYELTPAARRKLLLASQDDVAGLVTLRADAVRRLQPVLDAQIDADGVRGLLDGIELPLVRVLAEMEWTGVRFDVAVLQEMSRQLTAEMEVREQECWRLAGTRFNISSPSQVGDVLFGQLQIDPKAKRTKNGAWSTTEEILEKYRRDWPIVDLILQIRGLRKLLATYIDALPKLINPETGKVHTTFNQTVTATGRISSTNPNLQNIPIRTDQGREIRRAVVADPGCLLLSADYSQIELRLMACMSGDKAMVEAFNSGADIHRATAAKIYHEDIADVTDTQRRNAKTANFGIIYGISVFGLSERLGIPRSEAKSLIEGYMRTYPDVQTYMDRAIENARQQGYVHTVMGRRRYLPDISSRNSVVRGYAERNAINAPLQGSAADIIKKAMNDIYADMKARDMRSRMILQVHDELVFNVVPGEMEALLDIVTARMQGAYSGLVPLTVSAGTGVNWLEAH